MTRTGCAAASPSSDRTDFPSLRSYATFMRLPRRYNVASALGQLRGNWGDTVATALRGIHISTWSCCSCSLRAPIAMCAVPTPLPSAHPLGAGKHLAIHQFSLWAVECPLFRQVPHRGPKEIARRPYITLNWLWQQEFIVYRLNVYGELVSLHFPAAVRAIKNGGGATGGGAASSGDAAVQFRGGLLKNNSKARERSVDLSLPPPLLYHLFSCLPGRLRRKVTSRLRWSPGFPSPSDRTHSGEPVPGPY